MTAEPDGLLEAFFDALFRDDAEQLYDRAPCGYISTTPDGTVVKVNQTFLTMIGYDRAEVIGTRRFVDLLTAGGRIYHETHYAPMLRMHGAAHEIALDVVRADGSRLPVLVNSVLVRDADGSPVVVRTAVFDATHRREYERELLRAKNRAQESEARAQALAQTLQQTLIPPTTPSIPGLEVAAAYRPAGTGAEVGGDFYDVFQVGQGDWAIAIGDVCGKGVEAAVVTALIRYTLRAAVVPHPAPSAALAVVNDQLLRHDTDRFATVALARLRQEESGWRALVGVAGHPLPLLRRADGQVAAAGQPGSLIGVLPAPRVTDVDVRLEPGDALLLLTDGVTEGRRHGATDDLGLFGADRVAAVLHAAHASAEELTADLLQQVLDFQSGMARDDIAIVTARVPA